MMRVRRLEESDRQAWTDFVRRSCNGTVFHLPAFLDYHPEGRFDNHHLLIGGSSGTQAIVPGAVSVREDGRWFRSYPGASYGGPVLGDGLGLGKIEQILDALLDYCRGEGFCGVEMTLPPKVYFRRPHDYIDFALLRRGFAYRKRELTAVIDLKRLGEEVDLGFRSSARRGVRKARNGGVTVEENNDFSLFYPVLETNLKDRHGVSPTHTVDELYRLEKLLGRECIRQFIARGESGDVLAGMVMFHCNPRVTLAFYISHDERYQELRPVNMVYREVIAWARESGYSYLDLGTFTLNMEVNYGLCRFKESFSARGRFRDTFYGKP
jgi:hypothetical protein